MFSRRHTDKLIYPIILVLLLIFVSYRPKYRLRTEMPTIFFASASVNKNDVQRKIAGGYWQSALTDLQWKFPHGHSLPFDPPAEFRVDDKSVAPLAAEIGTRILYWHRLQQVWISPEAWTEKYEWDWSWTSDPFASASEWLHEHADLWLKAHGPN